MSSLNIGWPEAILLVLMAIDFGVALAKNGEARRPSTISALDSLCGKIIALAFLWWGGFFS